MISGMIYLYHRDGELTSVRNYACMTERNEILDAWRKKYAKGFNKCYIQICPNFGEGIKMDGTNKQVHRFKNRKRDYKNEYTEPII